MAKKIYISLYAILIFIYFLVTFFYPITAINQDLGEQLLQGRIISETRMIPQTNFLSYTYPNFPFISTYWLSSLIFFQLNKIGGFNLLSLTNTVIVGLAFGSLVFYGYKRFSLLSILLATTIYLSILRIRADIRPETFSMLFFSIFLLVLLNSRGKASKQIFLLIPLEILWVNFQIDYVFGPIIAVLFLLDDLISSKKLHFSKITKYLTSLVIGLALATLVNPNGIRGAISPIIILPNYGVSVTENQSLWTLLRTYFFSKYVSDPLLCLIVVAMLFLLLIIGRKNAKPIDWFLSVFFSLSVLFVFRNLAIFVLGTFLVFASQLNYVIGKYAHKVKDFIPGSFWFEASLGLLMILVVISHSVIVKGFGFGVKENYKGSIDFLQENNFSNPIYNNYNIGGYLAYRIYPNRVYIDNRPEAYPPDFTAKIYSKMQNDPEIFKSEDEKYHFKTIVVSYWDNLHGVNRLLSYLVNDSNFVPVYLDPYVVILIRNSPENTPKIQQFRVTKSSIDVASINNPSDLAHYQLFFQEVGWNENAKLVGDKLNLIVPKINRLLEPY